MAHAKRSDYLKSLNQMRNNYQNNGNALINREDDTTNVGNEMSSFAYMETPLQAPAEPVEQDKAVNQAEGYRFGDWYRTTTNEISRGIFNFFDAIGDFIIGTAGFIGGLFGADTKWATDTINYDWQSQAVNFTDMTANWLFNLTSGGYNDNAWQTLESAEASQQRLKRSEQRSNLEGYGQFAEGVGEALPSIIITMGTFGAGSPLTVGKALALNAGVSGVEGTGRGIGTAVGETNELGGREFAYGLTKGAIGAGTTFALGKIGGLVGQRNSGLLSKGLGAVGRKLFGTQGAEVVAGTIGNVLDKSASAFGRSVAIGAVEPYIKAIYDDGNAIEQVYGDTARTSKYFKQVLANAGISAGVAGVATAIQTGAEIGKEGGWEKYKDKYIVNARVGKELREISKYKKEHDKLVEDFKKELKIDDISLEGDVNDRSSQYYSAKLNGRISKEQFEAICKDYNNKFLDLQKKYDKTLTKVENLKEYKGFNESGVNEAISNMKAVKENVTNGVEARKTVTALFNAYKKANSDYASTYSEDGVDFTNANSSVHVDANGKAYLTYKGERTPLQLEDNVFKLSPHNATELSNSIKFITNNTNDPIVPKSISNIDLKTQTDLKAIEIPKEVANQIGKSKELTEAISKGALTKKNDNVFALKNNNNDKIVVKQYEDKYLVTKIDKNGKVEEIDLVKKFERPSDYRIIAKEEQRLFEETKAISKKTGKPIGIFQIDEPDNFKDNAILSKIDKDDFNSGAEYYLYSKKPLYEEDLVKALAYYKVKDKLNLTLKARREYNNILYHKTGKDLIEYLANKVYNGDREKALEKLGYDALIDEKRGYILGFNKNFIKGGNYVNKAREVNVSRKQENGNGNVKQRYDNNPAIRKLEKAFIKDRTKNIQNAQDRVFFERTLVENGAYEVVNDNSLFNGLKVVPKELYTPELNELNDIVEKELRGKLYIGIKDENGIKWHYQQSGEYNAGKVVAYLSRIDTANIVNITWHEITHFLINEYDLLEATEILDIFNKIYAKSNFLKEYEQFLIDVCEYGKNETQEELLCEIASKGIILKDTKAQDKIVNIVKNYIKSGDFKKSTALINQRNAELSERELNARYQKRTPTYRYKVIDTASNETIETNTRPTDRRYYDNKIKRWIDPTAGRLRSRNYRDSAQYNAVTTDNNVTTNVPAQAQARALGSKQPPNNNDNKPEKIISDKQRTSSSVLIEAGADVSKPTKVRLKSVKEAFETAIKEIMPKGGEFHIPQEDKISAMAELNLSRPKDRDTAISNMVKYLGRSIVTFKGENNNNLTFKLSDLMTRELENKARNIMEEVINGKAEPTKLAMWSKAFSLEKIKGRENVKSIKLLNRIDRKITSALKEYVGAPDVSKSELAIYTTLTKDVKAPFTNADITNLTNNVAINYTEDSIGKKLSEFGITTNKYLQELAKTLNASIVKGKALTAQQIKMANDCLTLIYNDLKQLGTSVKESNQEIARKPIIFAQSLGSKKPSARPLNVLKNIDYSTRSPANILSNLLGSDNPFTQHIVDGGKECDNRQVAIKKEWNNLLNNEYTKEAGLEKVSLLNNKIEFNGKKITTDEALSILLTVRSVGEDNALKNGIVLLDKNGNRLPKIELTKEKINDLSSRVLTQASTYANIVAEKWLNGVAQQYMSNKMYEMSGVTIAKLEDFYYPTSRAGQKEPDYKVSNNGSVDPITWGLSYLKERTNSQLPYLIRPFTQVINTYVNRITQWGEWATWYKKLRVMENTKVFGTTFTEQMRLAVGSQLWDKLTDFIHRTALDIPFNDNISWAGRAFDKVFGNIQKVKMLDLFTQVKTLGSLATGWQYSGLKISAEGAGRYIANISVGNKNINQIIFKYSPTLERRRKENIAFSANVMANANRKVSRALSSPVRVLDWRIHLLGFAQCQVQAKKEGYGDYFTDSNNKRAVELLEKYSDTTQPTTSAFNVGMYRAGANGVLIKRVFGMFASMGQNIYQGLYNVTLGWAEGVKRVNGYLKSIEHEQERIDFYTNEQKKYEEEMNKAQTDEEYIKAKEAKENADMHKKSHESNKQDYQEAYDKEAPKYTKAKWFDKSAGYIAGLVGSGIILTLIASLKKKVYGTEEWSEWDINELSKEALYQSFVNWIPYIGTLANSIKNDRDLTLFTLQDINDLIDASKTIVEAIQSGDGGKITGSVINALNKLSAFFGIPAESMWKLANGIWYNVDHASNIAFKNWLGMYKANYLKTNYNEAVKSGDHDKAVANLEVWLSNNSIPTSKEVVEEIYRLNVAGITGISPHAIPKEYTNELGETIKLTNAQINSFKKEYSKASAQIEKTLNAQGYKNQTDEDKASILKKIYNAYYDSAKAKIAGIAPSSKLAQLIYYCSNDIYTAKYVMSLQQLSTITERNKDNVIKEINKMTDFNKNEKLLLAYLSGYSASETNKPILVNFLMSLGMDREQAQTFLKIEL